MRVAVLGATGQLGTDLVKAYDRSIHTVIALVHEQIDVTNLDAVRQTLAEARPDAVINCAAFHHVDKCEDRPDDAFRVNAIGAMHVSRTCAELDAVCVYVSTDFVFSGEKDGAYNEDDVPGPMNVYGASKLAGEYLVRQTLGRWLIVRVASLFGVAGARGKGGNFVETILARARIAQPLRIVNDIKMSPTYAADAAETLVSLVGRGATGIVHLTNDGACTWYELARRALDLVGVAADIEPVAASAYPTKARRPKDSSLHSTRITQWVEPLRSWDRALGAYLLEKGHLADRVPADPLKP